MSDRNRFDKFTERARRVLSLSQEEAQRLKHNYIGTEHLLLGLVREGEGVAAKVLLDLGVQLNKVRESVEFIIGQGEQAGIQGNIGLTPRAKKVIELAVDEARKMNHHYIGTEHILLGLVREGQGIAAGILESMGVNLNMVRTQTFTVLNEVSNARKVSKEEQLPENPPADASEPTANPADRGQRVQFDRFTQESRRVLAYAQEEAQRLQHNYIGTEHLLLGILRAGDTIAARVLNQLGLTLENARDSVVAIIQRGDRIVLGEIGLTLRAKKVIERSVDEAQSLHHDRIQVEHLLLGLAHQDQGVAATVIEGRGITLEQVRAETLKALNPPQNA